MFHSLTCTCIYTHRGRKRETGRACRRKIMGTRRRSTPRHHSFNDNHGFFNAIQIRVCCRRQVVRVVKDFSFCRSVLHLPPSPCAPQHIPPPIQFIQFPPRPLAPDGTSLAAAGTHNDILGGGPRCQSYACDQPCNPYTPFPCNHHRRTPCLS